MISFLLNLLLMSLMLALLGIAALIFRTKWLRGRSGAMYSVWACVLLLCMIPLRLFPGLNLTGNYDFDSLMPEKVILPGSEADVLLPEAGDFKLTLIGDVGEVNAGERLDALYAIQPRVITGGLEMTPQRLLDQTDSYLFPFFTAALLVWGTGCVMSFLSSIGDYRRMKRHLMRYSSAYSYRMDGGRMADLLEAAILQVGVRRHVRLRVVDSYASVSPCVCGLLRPVIFVGEDILQMDTEQITLILTHELVHCHRLELIYKMAVSAVAAVHWFNPLMPEIMRAVFEDCELSCDSRVLALCGEDTCDYYMMTLLDVAEMYCNTGHTGDRALASGVYLAGSTGKSFFKRRYMNMKCGTRKGMRKGSAIFLALCLLTNVVIMSACGAGDSKETTLQNMETKEPEAAEVYKFNPIASAVYNYLGLVENSEISDEQLAEVKSIEIKLVTPAESSALEEYYEDMTLLCIYINGEYSQAYGKYVPKEDFEDVLASVNAVSEINYKKLFAFYTLKDPTDPELEEEGLAEMLEAYPMVAEGALYIFDPYSSPREINYLASFIESGGGYVPFEKTVEGLTELANTYIDEMGLDCTLSVVETTVKTESELGIPRKSWSNT